MALESSTQLSLVPCRKRSRIEKEDPYDLFNIDELPDDLLCKILKRLPSSQWVLQCKSVSKRWYSLISDPCFIRSFIHHRHCHQFSEQQFNFLSHYSRDECVVLPSNTSELCSRKISVNSLLGIEDSSSFSIEASFNDLLLVNSRRSLLEALYHICNPLTRECLTLPRPPLSNKEVIVGFICDPYSCNKEQGCITNTHYRYKVIRIYSPTKSNSTQLEMDIFSSETSEWCNSVVSLPWGLNPFTFKSALAGVVACNGMLHWVDTNSNGIVVFDPFNDVEQCHYIDPPIGLWATAKISLGLFQGRLRIFHNCDEEFYVWELKDNYGTWCMKHKVNLKKIVSQNSRLVEITKAYSPRVNFVAFHRNDGELVFLQFLDDIVLCNMRTRVLNIARTIPNSHMCSSLLLLQPSWPTPVPPLPLKFECPP